MKYEIINEELFYTKESITKVTGKDIELLKLSACSNSRNRVRLCAHNNETESTHEMIIVHGRGNYIPPHKHASKSESFHLIEGILDVVLFNDDGDITEIIHMNKYDNDKVFYYRIPENCYHTLMILSDWLVYHETTSGPFDRQQMIFAQWAPKEIQEEIDNQLIYMNNLNKRIMSFNEI
jgi:cupin fold WbuC family metalloprotein